MEPPSNRDIVEAMELACRLNFPKYKLAGKLQELIPELKSLSERTIVVAVDATVAKMKKFTKVPAQYANELRFFPNCLWEFLEQFYVC